MTAVLPVCAKRHIRVITNMGAANPVAAAAEVCRIARALGLSGLTVAAVTGDDVLDVVRHGGWSIHETGEPVSTLAGALVSANAYIGAAPLVEALRGGADVVIAGRVADPSLFLAPQMHEFGWRATDWAKLGSGTLVGHLLECAGQITGGFFADPGRKDIDGLARLGFPLAEVRAGGAARISKVAGSGGSVTTATCKEQLLYEVQDPTTYITPDVVADFSDVSVEAAGRDSVTVGGARGRRRPDELKVTLGYFDGYVGEGQISYAGHGAVDRARLALTIVGERFHLMGFCPDDLRMDLIGVNALHGPVLSDHRPDPYEVRVRVAGRARSMKDAVRIGNEVEALYTNGPAGGGGVSKSAREVLAAASTFVPRERVRCQVRYETA
jgi:hypothetical protein